MTSSLQSNSRKQAYALRENSEAFVDRHGIDHCLFLTLTFSHQVSPKEASECLKRAVRQFPRYFTDWIWTMGLGNSRRIHYHVLAVCPNNVREGINLDAYRDLNVLKKGIIPCRFWRGCSSLPDDEMNRQLYAEVSGNPALEALRGSLLPKLRGAGFGAQIHLAPIITDGRRIANYMQKNYLETVEGRDDRFRGARLVGYRKDSPRVCPSVFAWANDGGWRKKAKTIAQALGVHHYEGMRERFGPKWGYRIGRVIDDLSQHYGRHPEVWPVAAIIESAAVLMPAVGAPPGSFCVQDDLAQAA